jgi:putrescine transport system permease protein
MSRVVLWLGLGFLWAPVLLMAGFAFSDARQPFVWGGFSWRWFVALAGNERLVDAAALSVLVAAGATAAAKDGCGSQSKHSIPWMATLRR